MHRLVKLTILGPLIAALAASLPTQNGYIPGIHFRRFACQPIRTLPEAGHSRAPAANRIRQDFMREWCPPSSPIVFPEDTHYSQWGDRRPLIPRGPINPYRGLSVEGGSIPIIFPGQEHPLNSNLEPSNDIGFINSKMHPSLLNMHRQSFQPRWNAQAKYSQSQEPRL
ncbi:hypothetical protein FHG87_005321 [Trinorchestia longiramus]|nr:hypothetical protein FHG87_005321 [Trinorchestia longiramus]